MTTGYSAFRLVLTLLMAFATSAALAGPRARDLGVPFDGTPGPLMQNVFEGRVRISDDGLHHTWLSRENGKWVPILDGKPAAERYDTIIRNGPRCWEDGTVEFLASRDGKLYRVRYQPTPGH